MMARLAGVGLLLALVTVLAIGVPGHVADAAASGPKGHLAGAGQTPTPQPPQPQINPVSPNDDTVVRPDDTVDGVNGLPASGVGYTGPASDDVRRWTSLAMIALALNAVILFGLAVRSANRHRA